MKLREFALAAGIGSFAHAFLLAASVYAARAIWMRRPFFAERGPIELGLVKFTQVLQYPGTWLLPANPESPPSELLFFSCLALNSIAWGLFAAILLYAYARVRTGRRTGA